MSAAPFYKGPASPILPQLLDSADPNPAAFPGVVGPHRGTCGLSKLVAKQGHPLPQLPGAPTGMRRPSELPPVPSDKSSSWPPSSPHTERLKLHRRF